jgi:hypothetical protein
VVKGASDPIAEAVVLKIRDGSPISQHALSP